MQTATAAAILDAEDAKAACAAGVDAMVVSNHGGRQLDSAPSTISVLPEVVDAVKGRCEVLFDGGVQSGQDVLRALALAGRNSVQEVDRTVLRGAPTASADTNDRRPSLGYGTSGS